MTDADRPSPAPSGVAQRFLALGLGDASARLIAFGAAVYLARVLGKDVYGVIAFAFGVTLYLQQFADWGIEALGIPRIAAAPDKAADTAGLYIAGRLAGAVPIVVLMGALGFFIPGPEGPILALYALTLIPMAASTRWVHLGLGNAGTVGISRLLGETVMAVSVVAIVHQQDDAWVAPIAQFSGDALAIIWLWTRLARSDVRVRLRFDRAEWSKVARGAWPLVLHGILGLVIFNSDLLFLRWFKGRGDVGLYAVAYTLVSFMLNLGWAYAQSLLPALSGGDGADDGKPVFATSLVHAFVATAPVAVGGFLVAGPLLGWMFGPTYAGSEAALAILIWSVPLSVFRSVGLAGLLARERQDLALRTTTSSTVLNLVLNVVLIPSLGIVGAAWATLATEAARMTLALRYTHREGWPAIPIGRCARPALATVIMGAALWALADLHVLALVPIGGAVYVAALAATGVLRLTSGIRLEV